MKRRVGHCMCFPHHPFSLPWLTFNDNTSFHDKICSQMKRTSHTPQAVEFFIAWVKLFWVHSSASVCLNKNRYVVAAGPLPSDCSQANWEDNLAVIMKIQANKSRFGVSVARYEGPPPLSLLDSHCLQSSHNCQLRLSVFICVFPAWCTNLC